MLLDKLYAEGDAAGDTGGGAGNGGTAPAAAPPAAAAPAPAWYAPAETLKTTDPQIWESFEKGVKAGAHKDMASLIKERISFEKKLGTALTLPDKADQNQVKDFKAKLVKGGVDLRALASEAPASADAYQVNLDAIPEPMRSNEIVSSVKNWAHKHGLSNEALGELMAIEQERYKTTVEPALKYTAEQGEAAINDLAKEFGKEPDVLKAWGGRWLANNYSEEEIKAMESVGFANSPVAIKYAVRAGRDTGEDISVIEGAPLADSEYEEFENKLNDRNSAEYKLLYQADPQDPKRQALMAKREALMKRKFGTGEAR